MIKLLIYINCYLTLPIKWTYEEVKKNAALSDLSIFYTQENIKSSYKDSKFKISVQTWNDQSGLPDRSYLVSDIEDYL